MYMKVHRLKLRSRHLAYSSYLGTLDTMRHLKKDVTEVRKGSECGLTFADFADLREGDVVQMYEKLEKPGVL